MVAVVNEAFAERYFAGDNPIGHRLGLGRDGDPSEYEIVGVSADVKYQQLGDEQYPVAHVALRQHVDDNSSLTLAWRARGASGGAPDDRLGSDAAGLIAAAREVVRQVDPDIPVFDARTLEQQQATTLEMERLFARMSLVLGGLALGLASIGLYGVLSYNVERRTREIGVRRVLGARAADILRVVTGEVGAVLLGALLGLGLASAATGWLESLLYGLTPGDPGTYAAATAVLLAVAVLAAWLPARRASSVDPAIALRAD
jgi:hypothetical protein